MSTPLDPGFVGAAELPPYRALLVVDMKDYSKNAGRHQPILNETIRDIVRAAFVRCSLGSLWASATIHGSTGDGYFVGLDASYLPFLLNPYLGELQDELEDRNRSLPRAGHAPVRMRVSVSVGPMTDSGLNALADGAGAARVETHRLLDSDPVRSLLTESGPSTCVAAIVSARAYEDAVLTRYADDDPDLYVEVPVTVKTYDGRAYLRVPKPSGALLTRGFRPPDNGTTTGGDGPSAESPHAQPAVQINDHSVGRRGGIGNIAGTVGTIVTESSGPVHTGSQYLGDGTGLRP